MHPWFAASASPRVLAHRGFVPPGSEGVAENTAAAFAAAHAAGAAYVESDCHLTVDGQVVLFHDDDLSRVAGDPRPVSAVTFAELERIMSDRGGLLGLRQALDAFPTLRFNLDVKAAAAADAVGRGVARESSRVLLTSFSDDRRRRALAAARASGGDPATSGGRAVITTLLAAVTSRSPRLVRRALAGVDAVQVPERYGRVRIVTRRLVDAVHGAGAEVHVWTVNDRHDMLRLLDLGVDGLVSDRADLAVEAVASER